MADNMEKLLPPRHIAIIMDGNGRWAKKRGLPRTAGHSAGAEAFRRTANYCRTLGVNRLVLLSVPLISRTIFARCMKTASRPMTTPGIITYRLS